MAHRNTTMMMIDMGQRLEQLRGIVRPLSLAVTLFVMAACGGNAPSPISTDSATDSYARARAYYDKGDWTKAKLSFESLVYSHPGAAIIDSAQFLLAMCSYNLKDYIVAADEFRRLRTRYPNSPLVEEGDLLRCRALLRIAPKNAALDQEKTRDAITELSLFKDNHPLSPKLSAVDSLLHEAHERLSRRDFRTANLYQRLGRYQAARIYFQQVIDNYTDSPYVPDCLFSMAEGFRKQDSTDRALEYYEKMLYLYPDSENVGKAKKRIADLAQSRDTANSVE
jgi:outer membrane protein assembly factor BamD